MPENSSLPPYQPDQDTTQPAVDGGAQSVPPPVRDPNLGAAVGGYRNQRRPGWYMALVLLGVGVGALLALVVGEAPPPAVDDETEAGVNAQRPPAGGVRTGLVFSTSEQEPKATPDMIPAGTKRIYCHFRLPEIGRIDGLSGSWTRDGEPGGRIAAGSIQGRIERGYAVGNVAIDAPDAKGFPKGIYEVELIAPDGAIHEASFVVVEKPEEIMGRKMAAAAGVQISQATVCGEVTDEGAPQAMAATFAPDARRIYMAFKFGSAPPGSTVRVRWLYRGEPIDAATSEITFDSESGWAYAWIGADESNLLLEGPYTVVVEAVPDGERLAWATFDVKN